MKTVLAIMFALSLAGCASQGYSVRVGDDGVYYASSPPVYSYVDGYFGFPYYGPYSWAWYHPVWYSPVLGHHYSWCRPYDYWCGPGSWPGGSFAYHHEPGRNKSAARVPDDQAANLQPILPVDMRQMVIEARAPRSSLKQQSYVMPKTKYRAYDKVGRSSYASPRVSSSSTYRPSRATPGTRSVRPPVVRRDSENEY